MNNPETLTGEMCDHPSRDRVGRDTTTQDKGAWP
jgi:hypothetical protein